MKLWEFLVIRVVEYEANCYRLFILPRQELRGDIFMSTFERLVVANIWIFQEADEYEDGEARSL